MKRLIMLIGVLLMLILLSPQVFASRTAVVQDSNGTMDTATYLQYNDVILNSVSESDPVDYFRFRASTDQWVTVNVDVIHSDVQVYILNSAGEPMAYDEIESTRYNSTTPECAMKTELSPGTYYICITYTGTALNEYTLTLIDSKKVTSCTHVSSASGVMITDIAPSCTRSGCKLRTCMTCGYQWKTDLTDPRHSVSSWTVTREVTCEEDGSRTGTCSRCSASVEEEIPALGHTFTELELAKAPSASSTGRSKGICSVCEESVYEFIPALGTEATATYTVPDGYTSIGSFAFDGRTDLSWIILPDSVTQIGSSAFRFCTGLKWISLPSSLTKIENDTFYGCTGLTSVTLPNGLTFIGENAFEDCTALSSITIPSTVTSIGSGAFSDCEMLKTVNIPDLAAWCSIQFEGFYSNPLCYAVTFNVKGKPVTDLVIPKGVTRISPYAFAGASMLEEVTIPDSVTDMGQSAFYESGLRSITVGNGVTEIASGTFQDCYALETVKLGSGVQKIGYMAFRNCESLKKITFSDCLTEIDGYAFEDCTSLEEVTFPAGFASLGHTVFQDCTGLKKIFFLGDAPSAYAYPFPSSVTTGYYPADNETWTDAVKDDFGSWIQWNPCAHTFPGSSCTSAGSCQNCGAQGGYTHAYANATCTSPKICTLCKTSFGKPLPHTETKLPGKAATCTEEGLTEGMQCSVCGTVTVEQSPIPLAAHAEAALPGKESTCTEDGLTEGSACSVCGAVITAQQPIPAPGHSYTDDRDPSCDVCGQEREIAPASVPMFRMYDPNSGEHFYSGSELERDFLVTAGWHYEGVGFNFPAEGAPVHRLYDPVYGEHLYTMDKQEMNRLLNAGWNYEGVAFNSAGSDEVPQYRLRNPNAKRGGYHFTGSTEERDLLISFGWISQGIGWYSCLE